MPWFSRSLTVRPGGDLRLAAAVSEPAEAAISTSDSAAIGALAAGAAHAGLVLDFDGVLAPIVDDPQSSRMLPGTRELLDRVADRLGLLAILSGRPAAFLRVCVPCDGVELFGSYGLEADGSSSAWLESVRTATAHLETQLRTADGIRVERKAISVAVHWRTAGDLAQAEAAASAAAYATAQATGLRVEPGKFVLELRPATEIDKGTTLTRLARERGLRTVVYAGDDMGDTPALRYARGAGGYALLVDHGHETPESLRGLANERFDGVESFQSWLADLADALESPGPSS